MGGVKGGVYHHGPSLGLAMGLTTAPVAQRPWEPSVCAVGPALGVAQ